jgi:hypothetical protein
VAREETKRIQNRERRRGKLDRGVSSSWLHPCPTEVRTWTTEPQHHVKVGTRRWGKSRKNKCQDRLKKNEESKIDKSRRKAKKKEEKTKDKGNDKGKPTCYGLTCVSMEDEKKI